MIKYIFLFMIPINFIFNYSELNSNSTTIKIGDTIEIKPPLYNKGYQLLELPSDSKIIEQYPDYSPFNSQNKFKDWVIINKWKFQANKSGKYLFIIAHEVRNDIYSPYYWDFKRILLEVK